MCMSGCVSLADPPRDLHKVVIKSSWVSLCPSQDTGLVKRVEERDLRRYHLIRVIIWFQVYLLWILSLRQVHVSSVHLPQFKDWGSFILHVRSSLEGRGSVCILQLAINDIVKSSFHFERVVPLADLTLVSGLVKFVNLYLAAAQGVGMTKAFNRGRRLPRLALPLFQLQHNLCRGVTIFLILWCSNQKDGPLCLQPLSLCRYISHILDYSVKPAATTTVSQGALTNLSLLPLH